jgi:eukaryotic-like serine/threonine-protein kinase
MALIRCTNCGERLDALAKFCGACGTAIHDPNLDRAIGKRYVLRERIASGSLGIVYRAEQLATGRKLAIKMLSADASNDAGIVARFRREADVLCRLRSPHTVTTFEVDSQPDGSLYIVMELSPGIPLAQVLKQEGPLEWTRALRIMAQLCDSLAEAHEAGIIHRDLKPSNVLIEKRANHRDFVKVLDFGLAKLMKTSVNLSPVGQHVGDIEVSSPEQLKQQPLDGRSDLYALGVVGFAMMTGRHPFADERSYGGLVAAHLQRPSPLASSINKDLSSDVDHILARLLAKNPDQRYPTAAALAGTIEVLLNAQPPSEGATLIEPSLPIEEENTALGPAPDDKDT